MGFPHKARAKTTFTGAKKMYALKRLLHEARTNGYNWPILDFFRGGMDLQCVVNAYGAAVYILGYTTKAETEAYNEMVQRSLRETSGQLPETRQQLYGMGLKLLRSRRVSMHEAAFRMCSLPLKLAYRFEFGWQVHTAVNRLIFKTEQKTRVVI